MSAKRHVRPEQPLGVRDHRDERSARPQGLSDRIEEIEQLRARLMLQHAERADHGVPVRSSLEVLERGRMSDARQPARDGGTNLARAEIDAFE